MLFRSYEGGIRVPFIVRWPGKVRPQSETDHVSVQYDLMATVAEITGAPYRETDGISFLPVLKGDASRQREHPFLYFEYPENGGQIAVRLGDWKGVKRNMRADPHARWEIYDLKKDPAETTDLSDQYPDLIRRMNAVVQREHQHPQIKEWEFIDPKFSK